MEGKETFKNAVQAMQTAAKEALRRCEIDISQIKVHHSAPGQPADHRRRRRTAGRANRSRFSSTCTNIGNTSAASVAIALDEAVSGRVEAGDLILLVVFGAGLTWGAAVIEW